MSGVDRTDQGPVNEAWLDLVVEHIDVTGDVVALDLMVTRPSTEAQRFRAGLRASLHLAIAAGLLTQTDPTSWPDPVVSVAADHGKAKGD